MAMDNHEFMQYGNKTIYMHRDLVGNHIFSYIGYEQKRKHHRLRVGITISKKGGKVGEFLLDL